MFRQKMIVTIAIIAFLVLETLNVLMLYFTPGTHRGNGLGVFNAYEKSKADAEVHALVKYLINWVAGTKLIFIALLIVILITGNNTSTLGALFSQYPGQTTCVNTGDCHHAMPLQVRLQ